MDTEALYSAPHSDHYQRNTIQPIEYIKANNLSFMQGAVIKYVTRYKDKDGRKDLEKAIWYLQSMIGEE